MSSELNYFEPKITRLFSEDYNLFDELINIFITEFEHDNANPNETVNKELLNRTDFIALVALLNNKVVGGLTGYILPSHYNKKPEFYLYDIAVDSEYHRQGIGRKLINHLAEFCKSEGISSFYVQASATDTQANLFYKGLQIFNEEEVIHYTYWLKSE